MKRLMHIMLLSCLKATELIEKKLKYKLSTREKIQLKLHKMMCTACTNYENQSVFIEKGLKNQSQTGNYTFNLEQFKSSVIEKLEKEK